MQNKVYKPVRLNDKSGMTLIELIMAVIILSLVALGTASMIGAQIEGMEKSANLTSAGNAARLALEKLQNAPYASIVDGGSVTVGFYTATWAVTETVNGAYAKKDITVTAKRTGTSAAEAVLYATITNGVTYAP